MKKYGLIGKKLTHSFSKKYFSKKFKDLGIDGTHQYVLYEIPTIEDFKKIIETHHPEGLNVTIPYKEAVVPYLSKIDHTAKAIGAVNVIKNTGPELIGYNTDYLGFRESLVNWLGSKKINKALILGTGGASHAVEYALDQLNINYDYVSRRKSTGILAYGDLNKKIITEHQLIINTTPLGTYPNTRGAPDIPYNQLTSNHFLYDLVYNPEITEFMNKGLKYNANVKNGFEMLILQAEKSWELWNSN